MVSTPRRTVEGEEDARRHAEGEMKGKESTRSSIRQHAMDEERINDGVGETQHRGNQFQQEADRANGEKWNARGLVELIEAKDDNTDDNRREEGQEGGGNGRECSILSGLPGILFHSNRDVSTFLNERRTLALGSERFDDGEVDHATIFAIDGEHGVSRCA